MRPPFLEEYFSFLRFPSVSTDEKFREKVADCAQWVINKLNTIGLETKLVPTAGHPIVWAKNKHQAGRPTVMIYGHYDVQPPDPLDLWESPPFEPEVRGGRLYGRGVADSKSNHLAALKAVEHLAATGELGVDLRFLIEGE